MLLRHLVTAIWITLSPSLLFAATFTVTKTADTDDGLCDADCSLREAIVAANAAAGPDTIEFSIAGAGCDGAGVCTIDLTSEYPDIIEDLVIDGLSQPGADCAAWPPSLRVVLDGSAAGGFSTGLSIAGGAGDVRGLVIHSFNGDALGMHGDSSTATCNFIGTDVSGTLARPNLIGVRISSGTVGGAAVGARNLVSGNSIRGVFVTGSEVAVEGNFIGTDVTGASALPNGAGVRVRDAGVISGVTVGGFAGAGNVISGNLGNGVSVGAGCNSMPGGVDDTQILGNWIGVAEDGTTPLGNGGHGIACESCDGPFDDTSIEGTVIGGTLPGAANVIAANGRSGISIAGSFNGPSEILGNFIGTDATATLAIGNGEHGVEIVDGHDHHVGSLAPGAGNVIAHNGGQGILVRQMNGQASSLGMSFFHNSLSDNGGLGVDLQAAGETGGQVTDNDPGDPDSSVNNDGPNDLQNYPVLAAASSDGIQTTLQGSLDSLPGQTFTLEFFENTACDASGFGEGETWVDFFTVVTDGNGIAVFDETRPFALTPGNSVTVTATDANGSTSEFSACREVLSPSAVEVPALGAFGLGLLALLLGAMGASFLRPGRRHGAGA